MGTHPTTVACAWKRLHLMVRVQFTLRVSQRFFASECSQWTHNILLLSSGWEFFFWHQHSCGFDLFFFRLYGIRLTTGGVYPLKTQASGNTHAHTHTHKLIFIGGNGYFFELFLKCHLYYQWKDAASVWGRSIPYTGHDLRRQSH